MLVGGGELHERWSSLVQVQAPLGRTIQRFTGISQAMVDTAPDPRDALPALAARMEGRVLVAHNAAFDRRVLAQAFARAGIDWPDPPVLCTVALARRLLPLQCKRGLATLAASLGVEVEQSHRALPDAETCARVLCALFGKLCAHATTIGEALRLLRPRKEPKLRPARRGRPAGARRARPALDFGELPDDPGVYLFRDARGRILYVGKSVAVRSRAKAHFAPSGHGAEWTAQAEIVDYAPARSELGALLLESRLVKRHRPPGNVRLKPEGLAWMVCRLDVSFPVLEVAGAPAPGHAISIGPMPGRRTASDLADELTSLFALRHCGRRLELREHPSLYGQMGRCLSPCLGDLDPNAYRRRLDQALAVFGDGATPGARCSDASRTACARRRASAPTSGPPPGAGGATGSSACSIASTARCARPTSTRGSCSPATRRVPPGTRCGWRAAASRSGARCPAAPISSRAPSARRPPARAARARRRRGRRRRHRHRLAARASRHARARVAPAARARGARDLGRGGDRRASRRRAGLAAARAIGARVAA